ncbi:MAG: NAD(P)-dependent oxidoreductase [Sphingobium sp.]|nr:NAD(P)-dependent oxidoreductase [Sphingobium sp.]
MTGGTGFVGKAVMERALAEGLTVRALARRPQATRENVEWVQGDLDDHAALERLVAGAGAVMHIAGMVNAADRAAFEACNAHGTAALIAAMKKQGVRRLVHVSSLAAREPQLSDYGWSKAEAERHVMGSGLDWTMVRPPAIYGPHDAEFLELFQMATRGFILLPPRGRVSIIHADDLAKVLVTLARTQDHATHDQTYEVDDGRHGAWTHNTLAKAIGHAVGRKWVLPVNLPGPLVKLGGRIDRLVRGQKARLTPDRASYFCHDDWTARGALRVPEAIWKPEIETGQGLIDTARAYREKGFL